MFVWLDARVIIASDFNWSWLNPRALRWRWTSSVEPEESALPRNSVCRSWWIIKYSGTTHSRKKRNISRSIHQPTTAPIKRDVELHQHRMRPPHQLRQHRVNFLFGSFRLYRFGATLRYSHNITHTHTHPMVVVVLNNFTMIMMPMIDHKNDFDL